MKVAIHQPYYMPWAGWFHKMWAADVFVFYDDAQYSRGEHFNRTEVMVHGKRHWLTVPVRAEMEDSIIKAQVQDDGWDKKHAGTMSAAYGSEMGDYVKSLLADCAGPWLEHGLSLSCLTVEMAMAMTGRLKIQTPVEFSSELEYDRTKKKSDRLIEICKAMGVDTYISGSGGSMQYLDKEAFDRAGIKVEWQSFMPEEYDQDSDKFEEGLSVVDVVASLGWDGANAYIIRCGRVQA